MDTTTPLRVGCFQDHGRSHGQPPRIGGNRWSRPGCLYRRARKLLQNVQGVFRLSVQAETSVQALWLLHEGGLDAIMCAQDSESSITSNALQN